MESVATASTGTAPDQLPRWSSPQAAATTRARWPEGPDPPCGTTPTVTA